jgi:hypothetical protein
MPQLNAMLSSASTKTVMEQTLIPWVLANLASFAELKNHVFVFVHMLPVSASWLASMNFFLTVSQKTMTVLETLRISMLSISQSRTTDLRDEIFAALEQRDIFTVGQESIKSEHS